MSQLAGMRTFQSVRTVFLTQYISDPGVGVYLGLSLSFFRVVVVVVEVVVVQRFQWFQWYGGIVMQCQVLLSEQISVAGWVSIHSRHYLTNLLGQTRPGQHWAAHHYTHRPAVLYWGKGSPLTSLTTSTWKPGTGVEEWSRQKLELLLRKYSWNTSYRPSGLPFSPFYNLYLKPAMSLRKPVRPTEVIRSENYINQPTQSGSFIFEAHWSQTWKQYFCHFLKTFLSHLKNKIWCRTGQGQAQGQHL